MEPNSARFAKLMRQGKREQSDVFLRRLPIVTWSDDAGGVLVLIPASRSFLGPASLTLVTTGSVPQTTTAVALAVQPTGPLE